jgi:hypothetical protein
MGVDWRRRTFGEPKLERSGGGGGESNDAMGSIIRGFKEAHVTKGRASVRSDKVW